MRGLGRVYQSSVGVACATGNTEAGGLLLLLGGLVVVVVVGVGEDQVLRGRGGRFSSSPHRLLQQGCQVQTEEHRAGSVFAAGIGWREVVGTGESLTFAQG